MAQAKVFFARLTNEGRMYDPRTEGSWPLDDEHYTLVATVEIPEGMHDAAAREYAFERTNSIDCPWWRNPGVTMMCSASAGRSASVGDVVVLDSGAYRVDGCGWTEVPR
jgi:hypothetical protein